MVMKLGNTASLLWETESSHGWFCWPMRLRVKSKRCWLHWIAVAPTSTLRRLTHVYILKRKNFRIVFSVSNPFLILASINIWIFKAYNSLSPLPSIWPLTCLVAFWHLWFALLLFLFRMCVYYHGIIYSAVWSIRVVGNLYWYLLPSACWCVYCNTGVTVIN